MTLTTALRCVDTYSSEKQVRTSDKATSRPAATNRGTQPQERSAARSRSTTSSRSTRMVGCRCVPGGCHVSVLRAGWRVLRCRRRYGRIRRDVQTSDVEVACLPTGPERQQLVNQFIRTILRHREQSCREWLPEVLTLPRQEESRPNPSDLASLKVRVKSRADISLRTTRPWCDRGHSPIEGYGHRESAFSARLLRLRARPRGRRRFKKRCRVIGPRAASCVWNAGPRHVPGRYSWLADYTGWSEMSGL